MKGMKKKMREDEKKEKKQRNETEVSDCAEKREETKVRKGEREKERNSFLREETKNASSSSRHQQTSCEEDSSRFFRRASSCPAPRDFALLREGSSPSSSLASSLSSSSSSSSSEKSTNTSDEEEEEQEGREEERNEEEEDGEDEDGVTWDVWKGKDRTERRDHMREAKESRGRCRRTHSEEDLAELVEFLLSRGRRGTQEEEQERRRREEGKKGSVYLSRKFSKSEKTSPHAGTISLGGVIEEEKQEEKDKKKRGKEQQKEDEEGHVDDDEGKPISHSHTSSPSPSSLPPGVRPIVGDFSRTGSSVKSSDFYQKNPLASGVLKKKTLVLAFGKNTYGQLAFPLKHRDQPVVVDFSSVHSSSFQTPHASPLKLSSSSRPSSSPIHRTPSRKEKISSSSPVREGNSPSTFVSSAQGGGGVSSRSSSWRLRRDVSRVYCGRYHSAALLEGGYVCLWGRNTCGQLGRGGFDDDDEEEEEGEGEEKREGSPCSHDEETSLIGVEKTKKKSVSAPSSPSSRYRGLPRERYFQKKDEVTLYGEKESESSLTGKCEGKETNGDEGREQDEETGGSEEVKKRDESSRRDSSGECRDEKRDMVERERRQGEEEERKEESEAFQEKKEGWEKREQGGEGRRRSRSAGDEGMMRRKERQGGGGEEEEIHLGETRRRSCKDGFSCLLRDIEKASAHRDKGEEERENKEEEEEGERRRNQMRRMKKTLSFKTSYYSDPDERSSESSSSSSSHAVTPSYRRYPLYPPSSHLPDPHEHHPSHPHPDSSSTYRDPNKSNEASCISPTASSPNISRPSPPSSVPWYKRLLLFRRSSPQRGTPRRRDLSTSSSPPGVSRSSSKKEEKEDVERSTHSKSSSTPREKQGCRDTSCTSSSSSSSQRVRTPERSFTSFHTWFSSGKKSKKAGEQDAAAMKKKKIIDKRSSSSSSKKWEGGVVTVRALSLGTQGSLQRRRRRTAGMKTDKAFEWKPVLVQEFGYNASHKVIDIALGGRPRRMPLDDSYSWPEYRRIAAPVAFIAAGFKHSALIDAKEQLWLWGNNSYGQCGLDMSGDQHAFVFLPWRVKLPQKGLGIVQVALGKYHSLCLSEEGQVYGWGRARWGVLGLGRPKEPKRPLRALCSVHVTRIVCGDSHCAAIGVSRLGREAHEEFQLLQLNDSSLRKERILEELKRRSATAYDDEDLQKASSSSHPSHPFFSLFHSPQGGEKTATDFHAKNSFPTSHQSPQQGEKQGEDTSHGIREQGEGGEGHHEGSKSFSDRRRRSGGGGEGEELDSLVISVSAPDDMAASAKDFPLRPPSTSRSPSPVQKERNDGSSRRRLGEKELGKEDEEEEKKKEGGRRGRGGEEQEEDLVERQRRPAQEERKRREEGDGSSSPFMDSSSSKWMRTSITGREEGAKRVSGSYPSGSSLFPSSFEMRRGRDTVSGGLDGGANSGSSSRRRRSSDLDYFLSSQEMRRSLLLSAMTPAQRYRARLFEGTRGEDEASAPIKAQSDDELLLSDLELRKRWRLPETFCRPYGSERGSAAHQGGDHLYLWGKGTEGALGCNLLKNQYSPIELPFVLSSYRPCYIQIHDIALGGDFTLTLSGSYSTSFVIDKPVPPPSPREGALFAQTSLDIYRGRESSILHTRGRREVDKVEREGRQGDEEEDEELEGKIWQPHQSLSRGGLNKKTVNGSKGEGEERQKEEEEKKKKTEKGEITSPDSQKKKDKKKKTKEEKEGKREHKEEKKKKGEVPDETADESSLCLTSSFSSGDPKKSYRRGEKEEEGETKDPQGLPLPPGPAPSSPQSSFWIDKKREKEEERNPLAHSERVFSHQRARGSSRRRSSSGLSSKYNTGEEMANSDKEEEGKEKQEKEKKNEEEEEEEGVSSCGLRHEADHPLVPSSSQNARMGEEEKNLVNCESVREASVSPSVLSKSSVLHLPSSLDKDEEPRPLSVTPHPFTSSSSSPSSTSACTSNPSLPGIWNEVASGQTDRQEENKKKIHTLSVPLSSTHQECTLSSSLHSSLPVSYPAGISSFPSSSSSSQGVVSSSSILPVKNLPPGPHSSLSVYPSSSPGAFFLDTGNALSSSAMIPSSSSASSSSSSSP
ncbi:regulator of chromosome condensation repeat-containing protein, partial [Cystoisospora suis]